MKIHLTIALLLTGFTLSAHEVDQAFFKLVQDGSNITVKAKFPWTLRNALLAFDPNLEQANERAQFEEAFEAYILQNLILHNTQGRTLQFLGFNEQTGDRYDHHFEYLLQFEGGQIASITNTIMFDQNEGQTNYTTIERNGESRTYITTSSQPTQGVMIPGSMIPWGRWILLSLLLFGSVVAWRVMLYLRRTPHTLITS